MTRSGQKIIIITIYEASNNCAGLGGCAGCVGGVAETNLKAPRKPAAPPLSALLSLRRDRQVELAAFRKIA